MLGMQFMKLSVCKENLQERKNWSAQQVEEGLYHPRRMRQKKVRIKDPEDTIVIFLLLICSLNLPVCAY